MSRPGFACQTDGAAQATVFPTMKTPLLFLAVAALSFPLAPARAQDLPPEFREKMEALEKRAKEAKEAGRAEEAEKLANEMRGMKQHLQQRRKAAAMDKLRAEMEKAHGELAESEKHGREEAANGARHKVAELKAVMEKLEKDGDQPRHEAERPKPEGGRPRGEDGDARRRHLHQAAEHLHAAGMHDLAERVQREAGDAPKGDDARRGEQPERRPEGGGELQEMRQALRRLNARVEELEKKSGGGEKH